MLLINGNTTSLSNLTSTTNTIFTSLNSFSSASILLINSHTTSISNINATNTTLLGLINGHTTSISNLNATATTLLTTKQNNLTFSNPLLNTTNTISLKYDNTKLNVDASGNLTVISGTSQWNTVVLDIYYNVGNVGIGLTNPLSVLELYRSIYNGPLLTLDTWGCKLYNTNAPSYRTTIIKIG
jgi:hypothetical protein